MARTSSIAAADARWRASQARALNARSSMVGAPYVSLGDDAVPSAADEASAQAYARERLLVQCGDSVLDGLALVGLGLGLLVVAPLAYRFGKKAARG
jgi:hypothetical protein